MMLKATNSKVAIIKPLQTRRSKSLSFVNKFQSGGGWFSAVLPGELLRPIWTAAPRAQPVDTSISHVGFRRIVGEEIKS
jgi:hypothetical protein